MDGITLIAGKAPAKETANGKADPKKDNKKGGKGAPAVAASAKEEPKGLALFGGMCGLEVLGATTFRDTVLKALSRGARRGPSPVSRIRP